MTGNCYTLALVKFPIAVKQPSCIILLSKFKLIGEGVYLDENATFLLREAISLVSSWSIENSFEMLILYLTTV